MENYDQKYLNNAIYGSSDVVVGLNEKGKMIRAILTSSFSNYNYIKTYDVYFKIQDKILDINNLENSYSTNNKFNTKIDYNNTNYNVFENRSSKEDFPRYNQMQINSSNVVKTQIIIPERDLSIIQTDYINDNDIIRRIEITNTGKSKTTITPIISLGINSGENNVGSFLKNEMLVQKSNKNTHIMYVKNSKINSVRINNNSNIIGKGSFEEFTDYEGLSYTSSIEYESIELNKYEKHTIDIFLTLEGSGKKKGKDITYEYLEIKKDELRSLDLEKIEERIIKNDEKYVYTRLNYFLSSDTNQVREIDKNIQSYNKLPQNIRKIIARSIILLQTLTNIEYGSTLAALEVDEEKVRSGGYGYTWPRDMYNTLKLQKNLGNYHIVDNYFTKFIDKVLETNGKIEQRFFQNGEFAPSWGYQIDEIALTVISYLEYYNSLENTKNIPLFTERTVKFSEKPITRKERNTLLNDVFSYNCENLESMINFLILYINKEIYNNTTKYDDEFLNTYDLWENYKGINSYSLGSIAKAIKEFSLFLSKDFKYLNDENKEILLSLKKRYSKNGLYKLQNNITRYIEEKLYSGYKNSFVNNQEEEKIDISTVSLFTDFEVINIEDKKAQNTIKQIESTLKKNNGYLRYEGDNYIGGNWSLSSLEMINYYIRINNKKRAREEIEKLVNSVNCNYLISEQIDENKNVGIWVNGLVWAHSQFTNIILELVKNREYDDLFGE